MSSLKLTVFLIKVGGLTGVIINSVNLKEESVDTIFGLVVDVVPFLIINDDNSKIFKGKEAYDTIERLLIIQNDTEDLNKSKRDDYPKVTFSKELDNDPPSKELKFGLYSKGRKIGLYSKERNKGSLERNNNVDGD